MSAQENKALNRRLVEEGFSKSNFDVLDELIEDGCLDHTLPSGMPSGKVGVKQFFVMFRSAFPDFYYTIEDQVAEGDRVATRTTWRGTHQGAFLGIPPTGKQVSMTGIDITRWADGKAAEHWADHDLLGLMQQLGVVPAPGQTS